MKKLFVGAVLFFVPFVSFASTTEQVRASLVQQLLSVFVVQVNGINAMQQLVNSAPDPTQFSTFSTLLQQQLGETTSQLATLLNPVSVPVTVPVTVNQPAVIVPDASGVSPQAPDCLSVTLIPDTPTKTAYVSKSSSIRENSQDGAYYLYFDGRVTNTCEDSPNMTYAWITENPNDNDASNWNYHTTDSATAFGYIASKAGKSTVTLQITDTTNGHTASASVDVVAK